MKIWLKYLLGCILGIAMVIILQGSNEKAVEVINYISQFTIRAGKFALMPLLFFTMTVAIFELRDNHILLKTAFYIGLISIATTVGITLVGLISVLIFQPPRIPISVEEISQTFSLNILENIFKLVPESNFKSFADGAFLLPLYVFAGFAGAGCASDKASARPTLTLFDSLAKVSYSVTSFFIDMLAIGYIAVAFTWMTNFSELLKSTALLHLILLVAIDAFIIIFIAYPLILKLRFHERHPFRILYACTASLITAFFTADCNVTLGVSYRHLKESLGVDSKINSVALPIFSTFARGGTSMVIVISFIVILKSYSDMSITELLPWILGTVIALSFTLGALPQKSAVVTLAVVCSLYGKGFENGYLIMRPAAFFLCSLATMIDAATSFFGTYYIAFREKLLQHHELRYYI